MMAAAAAEGSQKGEGERERSLLGLSRPFLLLSLSSLHILIINEYSAAVRDCERSGVMLNYGRAPKPTGKRVSSPVAVPSPLALSSVGWCGRYEAAKEGRKGALKSAPERAREGEWSHAYSLTSGGRGPERRCLIGRRPPVRPSFHRRPPPPSEKAVMAERATVA